MPHACQKRRPGCHLNVRMGKEPRGEALPAVRESYLFKMERNMITRFGPEEFKRTTRNCSLGFVLCSQGLLGFLKEWTCSPFAIGTARRIPAHRWQTMSENLFSRPVFFPSQIVWAGERLGSGHHGNHNNRPHCSTRIQ